MVIQNFRQVKHHYARIKGRKRKLHVSKKGNYYVRTKKSKYYIAKDAWYHHLYD